jgi:putative cardiolipin synthase
MHNKLWIVDNAAAVIGGRNLGDEYFEASREVNFADLDILAAGPLVRDLSRSFDDFWNSERAVPIEAFVSPMPAPERLSELEGTLADTLETFIDTDYATAVREGGLGFLLRSGQLQLMSANASTFYDDPAMVNNTGEDEIPRQVFASQMEPIIKATGQEVILITPYFIPTERAISTLGGLARRGVRVRVLTNSLASTDYLPLAFAGYAPLRERLLRAGIELYEMRPEPSDTVRRWLPGHTSGAYLHTKAIIADRRHVVLGSMNLDPRSRELNTEIALVMDSPQLGARLAALFEEAVLPEHAFRVTLAGPEPEESDLVWISDENGQEVRYQQEPMTGFWRRWMSRLLGALAPEDML